MIMSNNEIAKYAFDDLDRRLIAHLRGDGRAPLSKLAEVLGVARGTSFGAVGKPLRFSIPIRARSVNR